MRHGLGLSLAVASLISIAGACSDNATQPTSDAPTIRLASPEAGVAYLPGASVEIAWTASDDGVVTGVGLSYIADGVAETPIATDLTGSPYTWTLPSSELYGVRVKATARDNTGQTGTDETEVFAIVTVDARGYVTSTSCQTCHADKYDDLFKSGHPYKVNEVVNGQPPTYPFTAVTSTPTGYTWDDITYVIGGYGWKARYMDREGYILVTGVTGVNTQYNLPRPDLGPGLGGNFVAYEGSARSRKPYTCGTCHATGWLTTAENGGISQDGLEGIAGTWVEPGIRCEQCHGPGGRHVATKAAGAININLGKELCGSCHFRDVNHGILASGGFIRHHEQYDELLGSPKRRFSCSRCHEPHIGVLHGNAQRGGIDMTCETCHSGLSLRHPAADCEACHMPRATRTALSVNAYEADIRTHLFKINTAPLGKASMFTTDQFGNTVAIGFVTLDFACYSCHTDGAGVGGGGSPKTLNELSARAIGIHR